MLVSDADELYITPNNFIVDQYDDLVNFKTKFIPELVREQLATMKITRVLNYLQLCMKISYLTYFQLQNVLTRGRAMRVETLLLTNFL